MLSVRNMTTIGATALVLAAPAAARAEDQDLRAPDSQDVRAPVAVQDLRAPDHQDVTPVGSAPAPTRLPVTAPTAGDGFEWGDAGIGAAGGVALAMLGLGGAFTTSQRLRRNRQTTSVS